MALAVRSPYASDGRFNLKPLPTGEVSPKVTERGNVFEVEPDPWEGAERGLSAGGSNLFYRLITD